MSSRIDSFEDFVRTGVYLRNWSPRTVRTYRQAWSSFQSSLQATSTEHGGLQSGSNGSLGLGKAELEAWIVWLRQKGVTPGGCNMYIRTMNSFLSWLSQEGHLEQKLRLRLLPNPTKPLQGFSDIEIRSLLSFRPVGITALRTWTLISTLLDTGCRIEEILTLQTDNVDSDNTVIKVFGKGSKIRIVPFSFELRKSLYRFQQIRDRQCKLSNHFFCTRDGHRLSYRNTFRDIKTLCAKAGVEGPHVHPHAFRHCFAVTYIRRGGDIYRLSRILGHTSISTTQVYLRSMGIEQVGENHSSLSPLNRG